MVGVFPAHGFTTLYYLVRKHASRPHAENAMDEVLKHFEVGNLEATGWTRARSLSMTDFEDAVWRSWRRRPIRNSSSPTHRFLPLLRLNF